MIVVTMILIFAYLFVQVGAVTVGAAVHLALPSVVRHRAAALADRALPLGLGHRGLRCVDVELRVALIRLPEMIDVEASSVVEEDYDGRKGRDHLQGYGQEDPPESDEEQRLVAQHEDNLRVWPEPLRQLVLIAERVGKVLVEGVALLPRDTVPREDKVHRAIGRGPEQIHAPRLCIAQVPGVCLPGLHPEAQVTFAPHLHTVHDDKRGEVHIRVGDADKVVRNARIPKERDGHSQQATDAIGSVEEKARGGFGPDPEEDAQVGKEAEVKEEVVLRLDSVVQHLAADDNSHLRRVIQIVPLWTRSKAERTGDEVCLHQREDPLVPPRPRPSALELGCHLPAALQQQLLGIVQAGFPGLHAIEGQAASCPQSRCC
mmetsp:Transcript_46539/g.120437  ORF Transcript_46539/g.120437 Transcript_46539/m.120437 type:complete len:374 (+) Transcript_46539:254-1375(+)